MARNIIIDADNPLFKKAHPILLDIFWRGIQSANTGTLMLVSALGIAMAPVSLAMVLFFKGIHLIVLLGAWLLLREYISEYAPFDIALVMLVALIILYKGIYGELVDIALRVLIIITGGSYLRWVGRGYLSGTGFRQWFVMTDKMQALIGTLIEALPFKYRNEYNKIMDLYLASNEKGNEEKLNSLLDDYDFEA